MSNPSPTQNRKQTDPNLKDLLDLHKKDILLSTNCHAVATVQSFDPTKQTITATINYKKSFVNANVDGSYTTTLVDYPILLDVPVIILSGGQANLTFPIQAGDTCLILFHDRDLDNWLQSGQIGPLASQRLHSLSDGIALVGLRPANKALDPYDPARAVLALGQTMVAVGEEKIKIANAVTTLNTLLQSLLTQLQLITVICATPGNPSGPPVNAAAIAAIATQLGGLLE